MCGDHITCEHASKAQAESVSDIFDQYSSRREVEPRDLMTHESSQNECGRKAAKVRTRTVVRNPFRLSK
jgi:hypothetical protein